MHSKGTSKSAQYFAQNNMGTCNSSLVRNGNYFYPFDRIVSNSQNISIPSRSHSKLKARPKMKIFGTPQKLKNEILHQMHNSVLSGHLGKKKTKEKLSQRFFWFEMRKILTFGFNNAKFVVLLRYIP
jgi:hypothetical protein